MQTHRSIHWPTVIQFALSGLGVLLFWGLAAVLVASALFGWLNASALLQVEPDLLVLRALGLGFLGALLVPSLVFSFLRLLGRAPAAQVDPARPERALWLAAGALLMWLLCLGVSLWTPAHRPDLAKPLQPLLLVFLLGLPVWIYLLIGRRGLPSGSPQRTWGMLGLELVGGTTVILVVELALFLLLVIGAAILIASRPEVAADLQRLATRIANSNLNPDVIGRILRPYLLQPVVIYLVLLLLSGLIPLIEELLKVLPLWLFARSGFSPAEGFTAGLLCGAGFALFESMGVLTSSAGADQMATAAIGRAGTDLVHILNSGLMGWALASAWSQARYWRLGLTYLLVIAIHGLWNAISLWMGVLPWFSLGQTSLVAGWQPVAFARIALAVLAVALLLGLLLANRALRRQAGQAPAVLPEATTSISE